MKASKNWTPLPDIKIYPKHVFCGAWLALPVGYLHLERNWYRFEGRQQFPGIPPSLHPGSRNSKVISSKPSGSQKCWSGPWGRGEVDVGATWWFFWLAWRLCALVWWVFRGSCCCVCGKILYLYDALRSFCLHPGAFFVGFPFIPCYCSQVTMPSIPKGPTGKPARTTHLSTAGCVVFEKDKSSCCGISLFSLLFVGWKLQDQFGEEAGLGTFGRRSEGPPMPERIGWKNFRLHGFCIVDIAFLKRLGSKCIDESPQSNTKPMQIWNLRTLNILGFKGSAFGLHLIRQFWDPFFAPLICTVLRLYRQGQLPPVGRCDSLPRRWKSDKMGSWQAWTSCEHDVLVPKSTLPWLILIFPMKLGTFQINSDYFIFVGNSLSLKKFFSLQFYSKADKWVIFLPSSMVSILLSRDAQSCSWFTSGTMKSDYSKRLGKQRLLIVFHQPTRIGFSDSKKRYTHQFQTPCLTKEEFFQAITKHKHSSTCSHDSVWPAWCQHDRLTIHWCYFNMSQMTQPNSKHTTDKREGPQSYKTML